MANEMLTKGVKLSYKESSSATSYTQVANLFGFPDLGGDIDKVEVTNLDDGNRRYIPGLVDYGDLEFDCYYSKAGYKTLKALEDAGNSIAWQIELPDGGIFDFTGVPFASISAGGINDALQFKVKIALDSDMAFTPAA